MFDEKDLVLEAKHVTRRFPAAGGRQLLACNDVNLKMYKGKTLGLVGESGCGKSTFMRFLVYAFPVSCRTCCRVPWSSIAPSFITTTLSAI